MVAQFINGFEGLVSRSRLDRYKPTNGDPIVTLTNYLWNVELSESLLQSLSSVEIGLRNGVHRVLTARHGSEYWFWGFLAGIERDNLNKEWNKLTNTLGRLPTADNVIAHQSCGFWGKVFEGKYDPIWSENNSALLWQLFPNHPRAGITPMDWLTRHKIQKYTHLFLDLRNRAMHHEPIYQGIARPDEAISGRPIPVVSLWDVHEMMCDFLGWIDPKLCTALSLVDRFEEVHNDEWDKIKTRIEAEF